MWTNYLEEITNTAPRKCKEAQRDIVTTKDRSVYPVSSLAYHVTLRKVTVCSSTVCFCKDEQIPLCVYDEKGINVFYRETVTLTC